MAVVGISILVQYSFLNASISHKAFVCALELKKIATTTTKGEGEYEQMAKRFEETKQQRIVHDLVENEDFKFAILITVDEGNDKVSVATATNEKNISEGASILLSRIYEAIWPRNKQPKCANKYPI